MRKANHFNHSLTILQELHRKYPTYTLGQHFSTAFSDYGDIWGITDKEFVFALEKYQSSLEMNYAPEQDIEKIIEEGMHLDTILDEEEDEDD